MNLIQATKAHIGWSISVWRKIRKLALSNALKVVASIILSQFCLVLAYFLPLKVILLVATEGVPWYLASFVTPESKNPFILLLATGAIAFYAAHMVLEYLVSRSVQRGSETLLASSNKMAVFDNQETVAKESYLRLCRSAASFFLFCAGILLGLLINAVLFWFLALVVVAEFLIVNQTLKSHLRLARKLEELVQTRVGRFLNSLSAINFLVGFSILLTQFILMDRKNVLIAILCILLLRQVMLRLQITINDTVYLHSNIQKINALFYTHIHYLPPADKTLGPFLTMLQPAHRDQWLADVVREIANIPTARIRTQWVDSGIAGIAWLWVTVAHLNSDDALSKFFVKVYSRNRLGLATHERCLFESPGVHLRCAPALLGFTVLDHCYVMLFDGIQESSAIELSQAVLTGTIMKELWCHEPPKKLVDIYKRTRPTLTERITHDLFSRLLIATSDDSGHGIVSELIDRIHELKTRLSNVPLSFINPRLLSETLIHTDDGFVVALDWTHWSLEPIGVGLPTNLRDHHSVESILKECSEFRECLCSLPPSDVLLSTHTYEIERCIHKQNYQKAFELIPEILYDLGSVEATRSIQKQSLGLYSSRSQI